MDTEITLPADEWLDLGPGNFFAFLDGAEAIEIEFWHDSGRLQDSVKTARPGYWAQPPRRPSRRLGVELAFTNVRVKSTNAQDATILVLEGEGGERRLTGTVEVISGNREITEADRAFVGDGDKGRVAGEFTFVQLLNPAGSGKRLIINRIDATRQNSAGSLLVGYVDTAQGTLSHNPLSLLNDGAPAASVATIRTGSNASRLVTTGTNRVTLINTLTGEMHPQEFDRPIIMNEGGGLVVEGGAADEGVVAAIQYVEEAV